MGIPGSPHGRQGLDRDGRGGQARPVIERGNAGRMIQRPDWDAAVGERRRVTVNRASAFHMHCTPQQKAQRGGQHGVGMIRRQVDAQIGDGMGFGLRGRRVAGFARRPAEGGGRTEDGARDIGITAGGKVRQIDAPDDILDHQHHFAGSGIHAGADVDDLPDQSARAVVGNDKRFSD
ncbi:MAG: hypothetical protein CAPSK01_004036 [Candidatus Accumulibacter vicinus]|uniref:Uncharacterized protein n=1 Tax=Candidatus Accumulibacter vicinus TaxID=2954382 RepID=A0A084XW27_9PROT|nr:MAG: hypothetical protein CAPSK01_004036 [Candidatus Accumulibacter vicinus]